jgi:uncharacterized membrane protein
MARPRRALGAHLWRYTIIGVLTVAPLWVTWLVFDFILRLLSRAGAPGVVALSRLVRPFSSLIADGLLQPAFHFVLAVLLTLLTLYAVGWVATRLIGKRILAALEAMFERVPLVRTIYRATKRFVSTLSHQPTGLQRVVLINFPSPEMKAVGFVTRIMTDETTGREVAAVYVPTSPNPTSGYIEIVPLEQITATDWSVEEAMNFVMTGGTNAPASIRYTPSPPGG